MVDDCIWLIEIRWEMEIELIDDGREKKKNEWKIKKKKI